MSAENDREAFETLLQNDCFRLERIVSQSHHATPEGEWFDQPADEWVILLRGSAGLTMEGEAGPIILNPGDHLLIPAHKKHRVEWTSPAEKTVWLAVHFRASVPSDCRDVRINMHSGG
ncbi:MAG: cupin domain-containing protein [Methylococcaceae bacterium]|nr:cupin domain-containing protein [Methylococcaceae bacterium]